ncbi:hypothetical protein TNCV_1006611 [Trichonephila clavipes]|nr:hypothetical protein TNCV_1006611 [Trichonephila clavipes]
MPRTSSPVSTVSTLSSSTQAHLLLSTSAIIPTIQSESLLPISIPTTTTFPGNNLNTSASSLETETRPLITSNKFPALSTEIQPLVPLSESVHSEHSNAPEIQKPRKLVPTEYATDEEDMITYDVEEDEREPNPTDKFVMGRYWRNNPDKYLRAVTPTRFRK